MKAIFLLIAFLLTPMFLLTASGDLPLSPSQMEQVQEELRRRNITEAELTERLKEKGIDLESIPPEELPNYQGIILDTVNELEAEKRAAERSAEPETQEVRVVPVQVATATPVAEEVAEPKPAPELTPEPATDVLQIREVVVPVADELTPEEERVLVYGHELFTGKDISVFRTTEGARAPDTYILGPGDQVRITIFGASQADMLLEINSEGYIQPYETPQIYLKGLTIAQAKTMLAQRLSQFYTFRSDQFALTIQTARTITVNVFGESKQKGSFTMSALNTAFNALAASGGPTEIGSVRKIQHIRGNETKTLDVYAFMHNPSIQFDFDLQHNDIIYIPIARKVVRIAGAVKRPKRYELIEGENIRNLIEYAGGINYDTYPDFLQVQRIEEGEVKLTEYSLAEALRGDVKIDLQDGDIVRLRQIEKPLEKYVEIEGAVFYDGRYDLRQNPTLNRLLERAEIRPQAKTDLVFVERVQPDESIRIIPIRWEEISERGEIFTLEARDRIRIFDLQRYRNIATLRVSGDVRSPLERTLHFDERIRLDDALELAGGLNPTAADTAIVVRRDLFNPLKLDVIRVEISQQSDFQLQPGDVLTVYDKRTYTDTETLRVRGNIRNPVDLTLQFGQSVNLSDALLMAGGLQPTATDTAIVVRRDLLNPLKLDVIRVEISQQPDFQLQPGDVLTVYDKRTYTDTETLRVQGNVRNPVELTLQFGQTVSLSDALVMAGGLQPTATDTAIVVRRDLFDPGKVDVFRVTLSENENFSLQPGDVLTIYDRSTYADTETLIITGNVRNPIERTLPHGQTIRLADALVMAGGLRPSAANLGYVIRVNLANPDFVEHIAVNLLQDDDFRLQPGDQLFVYSLSTYTNVPQISVQGAVNNPFSTTFEQNLTITDLLKMAGGLTEKAALNRVDVFRLQLSHREGTRFDRISLNVDYDLNLIEAFEDFQLRPYDQVVVRQIPMFEPDRSVQLSGEVMYPGSYPLESRRIRLSDLINEAGGLTPQADPRHATLIRSFEGTGPVGINLRKALSRRRVDRFDPIIMPGDVITIPKDHNVVSIRIKATRLGELERRDLLVDTEFVPGTQEEVVTFVYQGSRSAKWYIENFAGGFAPEADRRSVTVTKRNGQVLGTKRRLFVFNNYPNVKPGSTIALTYEPPPDPSEREEIDWDRIYARTMTGLTTLLTFIVLLDRVAN